MTGNAVLKGLSEEKEAIQNCSQKVLAAAGPASEDRDGNHFILGQADTVRAIREGTQLLSSLCRRSLRLMR